MDSLLFINAFFERELTSLSKTANPFAFLLQHPLYLQLQYLSCLIADENEIPLVSHIPEPSYLDRLATLGIQVKKLAFPSSPFAKQTPIYSWGVSSSLSLWAKQKGYSYSIPSIELVKKIHSKEFAFLSSPPLDNSCMILKESDLIKWWNSFNGAKVLKTLYGSSGRGHFISSGNQEDLSKALLFLKKQQGSALVAQPWVERLLDFSTQWNIEKNGSYSLLGSTLCQNNSKGVYQKSIAGPEAFLFKEHLPLLQEHIVYAKKAINEIISFGFFGNIGFDAMIYKNPNSNKISLLPILEINARKTMGWVCLKLQKKLAKHDLLSLSYESNSNKPNWLPYFALDSEKNQIIFPKKLHIETAPTHS